MAPYSRRWTVPIAAMLMASQFTAATAEAEFVASVPDAICKDVVVTRFGHIVSVHCTHFLF